MQVWIKALPQRLDRLDTFLRQHCSQVIERELDAGVQGGTPVRVRQGTLQIVGHCEQMRQETTPLALNLNLGAAVRPFANVLGLSLPA